ncbi:MAG: polysaccharide deacetylase family protein [Fibrobacter sp.]|nr:polysaccharide deacetylase family protein [Fibrobacter sp.]
MYYFTNNEQQTHQEVTSSEKYPVHLTFDDGPHLTLTPKVLDILNEEDIQATFFVLGEHFDGGKANVKTLPFYNILERAKKDGHTIGSHTYSHINHLDYSETDVHENILKPNSLLKEYLSPVLRLPYGGGAFTSDDPLVQAKNTMVMNIVKHAGFTHVLWDIDSRDWDKESHGNLFPSLLSNISKFKGGIILFHDAQEYTVNHLREWIKGIKGNGHVFKSIDYFIPLAANTLPSEAF